MWGQGEWRGHRGWGWGHGGWFLAPLLLFGAFFFFLFFIFKTGLWIPLLLIGLFFWFFSPMRGAWSHGGRRWAREWRDRWQGGEWGQRWNSEAWKHEGWKNRRWGWGCEEDGQAVSDEKAKRETSSTGEDSAPRSSRHSDYV